MQSNLLWTEPSVDNSIVQGSNLARSKIYSQPRLIRLHLISYFQLICHYPLDTPHWQPIIKTPKSPLQIHRENFA